MDKQWCHHQWKGVSLVDVHGWGLRHRLHVHCRCVVVGPPHRCLRVWRCRRCMAWLYRRHAVCSWSGRNVVPCVVPCPCRVVVRRVLVVSSSFHVRPPRRCLRVCRCLRCTSCSCVSSSPRRCPCVSCSRVLVASSLCCVAALSFHVAGPFSSCV